MQLAVLLLLIQIPSATAASQTPQTRLWDAAITGDTVALASALRDGANVDSLDRRTARNGRRALNWAALNNRVDAIRFLLAHGANIEATNITGLHGAASRRRGWVARSCARASRRRR